MKLENTKTDLSADRKTLYVELAGNVIGDLEKVFVETRDTAQMFVKREEDDGK